MMRSTIRKPIHFAEMPRLLARLAKDRRGAAMAYFAVITPIIVGSAALSADIAFWHMNSKAVQSAADSAAIAAAGELIRTGTGQATLDAAARDATLRNGVEHNGADTTVQVIYPPPPGAVNEGSGDSVHVIVTRPARSFFGGMLNIDETTIRTHATARGALNSDCIWVLSPDKDAALNVAGGAVVNLGCGAFSNSEHPTRAIVQEGGSQLISTEVRAVGGVESTAGGLLKPDGVTPLVPVTGVAHVDDPLAGLPEPVSDVDTGNDCSVGYERDIWDNVVRVESGATLALAPDGSGALTICKDIVVTNLSTLTLAPGTYIFNRAGLRLVGSGKITGTGVHIFFTRGNSPDINDQFTDFDDIISIASGSTIELLAGNTGPLKGILVFHSRMTGGVYLPGVQLVPHVHLLKGGNAMNFNGVIYSPANRVLFAGGANLNATSSMLIVDSITFTGNTDVGSFSANGVEANTALIAIELID